MIDSRLYYNMKELSEGIVKFHYFTDEINKDSCDLKSYAKKINRQEMLFLINEVEIKNILYNINEVEYSKLLIDVEKYKNYIDKLSHTDPSAANIAITKLWGPNELQRKFLNWFEKSGYAIPKK